MVNYFGHVKCVVKNLKLGRLLNIYLIYKENLPFQNPSNN